MPELPEVETLCRQLQDSVLGRKIVSAVVLDPKIKAIAELEGRKITGVSRHGKWLTVTFSGGIACRFHLRMTGRIFHSAEETVPAHSRLIIKLGKSNLFLVDPRRFATAALCRNQDSKALPGTDALTVPTPDALYAAARTRKVSVKTFLLDQKTLAGIGNIYACEILHSAKIDPQKEASSLSRKEWKAITQVMPGILEKAVSCRGTSISDWRDLFGQKGEFQNHLLVYGKEGNPCPRCGAAITRIKQSGRSTFYCPACQK